MRFSRENSYCSIKHKKKTDLQLFPTKLTKKKILGPYNAKEKYQSYLKRKTT